MTRPHIHTDIPAPLHQPFVTRPAPASPHPRLLCVTSRIVVPRGLAAQGFEYSTKMFLFAQGMGERRGRRRKCWLDEHSDLFCALEVLTQFVSHSVVSGERPAESQITSKSSTSRSMWKGETKCDRLLCTSLLQSSMPLA